VDDDQNHDENLARPDHSNAKENGDVVIDDPAQRAGQNMLFFGRRSRASQCLSTIQYMRLAIIGCFPFTHKNPVQKTKFDCNQYPVLYATLSIWDSLWSANTQVILVCCRRQKYP
jgi:hypothetical protein